MSDSVKRRKMSSTVGQCTAVCRILSGRRSHHTYLAHPSLKARKCSWTIQQLLPAVNAMHRPTNEARSCQQFTAAPPRREPRRRREMLRKQVAWQSLWWPPGRFDTRRRARTTAPPRADDGAMSAHSCTPFRVDAAARRRWRPNDAHISRRDVQPVVVGILLSRGRCRLGKNSASICR
jgi:hypothetical protein